MEIYCNNKLTIVSEEAFEQPKSKGANRCSTVLEDDDFTKCYNLVLSQFTFIFLFVLSGKFSVEGRYAFVKDSSFLIQILCVDILRSVSRSAGRGL
jgi:hypothetical protein